MKTKKVIGEEPKRGLMFSKWNSKLSSFSFPLLIKITESLLLYYVFAAKHGVSKMKEDHATPVFLKVFLIILRFTPQIMTIAIIEPFTNLVTCPPFGSYGWICRFQVSPFSFSFNSSC